MSGTKTADAKVHSVVSRVRKCLGTLETKAYSYGTYLPKGNVYARTDVQLLQQETGDL